MPLHQVEKTTWTKIAALLLKCDMGEALSFWILVYVHPPALTSLDKPIDQLSTNLPTVILTLGTVDVLADCLV